MRASPTRDLIVGFFVLAGLAAVGWLSIQVGGLHYTGDGGLVLKAYFTEIGSLKVRAPVVISGVKVGQVTAIDLSDDLRALVTLEVDSGLDLPVDTSAAVRTAGLLGDQFIALEPGGEEEPLRSGEFLERTDPAIQIERLIGALVHGAEIGGSQ